MGKSSKQEKSKKKHKHKEREEKKRLKKSKKRQNEKKEKLKNTERQSDKIHNAIVKNISQDDFAIPVELMNRKSHAPETPEEYKQRQNRIRREIDPTSGRSRLIKGDGEVLEEIVSKGRHKAINKEATKGDGDFFQENTLGKLY